MSKYQRIREAVLDGVLPVRHSDTGRWYFSEANLPAIIEALTARGHLETIE